MLIPSRLKFLGLITATAYALIIAASVARGQGLQVDQADLPKLIEAAQKAGIKVGFEQTVTDEHASGTGAGGRADGGKLDQQIDSSAPKAALPGGASAEGGNAEAKTTATASVGSVLADPKFWLGIALVLLGAAMWIGPKLAKLNPAAALLVPNVNPLVPLGLGGAGGCLIAWAIAPGFTLACVFGLVAFLVGPKIVAGLQAGASKAKAEKSQAEIEDDKELLTQAAAELRGTQAAFDALARVCAGSPETMAAILAWMDAHPDDDVEARMRDALRRGGAKFAPPKP